MKFNKLRNVANEIVGYTCGEKYGYYNEYLIRKVKSKWDVYKLYKNDNCFIVPKTIEEHLNCYIHDWDGFDTLKEAKEYVLGEIEY